MAALRRDAPSLEATGAGRVDVGPAAARSDEVRFMLLDIAFLLGGLAAFAVFALAVRAAERL